MDLQPEIRKGYYISAKMKKVWAVEMELLNKLLEVCKKYNLRIFAEGGTLLGAVREHGYIPWDDDVDMAMLREDYDKLREVARDEFRPPFFFQCGYTDLFPNGITRLRKDGTAAITYKSISQKCHQGIFIDIFPLDSIPDNSNDLEIFVKHIEKLSKIKFYNIHHFSFFNLVYDWEILKMHFLIERDGFSFHFRKYDDFLKQYVNNDCSRVSIVSWSVNPKYVRNKDWYSDAKYLPFENILLPVPNGYDDILTKQYGDYLNPVKAPTEHGGFLVLDSERSYLDYLPKLRKEHKWDSWKNRFKIIKEVLNV